MENLMAENNVTAKLTLRIVIGEAVVLLVMSLIFLLIDRFDYTVLAGGLLGAVMNVIYFLLMCLGVNRATGDGDPRKGKFSLWGSYYFRLFLLGVGVAVGLKFAVFNNFAVIIPVLMTRPILTVWELFIKSA